MSGLRPRSTQLAGNPECPSRHAYVRQGPKRAGELLAMVLEISAALLALPDKEGYIQLDPNELLQGKGEGMRQIL